jgi:hypothetical protein
LIMAVVLWLDLSKHVWNVDRQSLINNPDFCLIDGHCTFLHG